MAGHLRSGHAPNTRVVHARPAERAPASSSKGNRLRGAWDVDVVLLNKPYGVVCQFSRHASRPTLKDYVPMGGVYPAGRLDWDSEGLVVLTDDGVLQHRITDPRAKMPKTYWVQVERTPDAAALGKLRQGIDLGTFVTLPAQVHLIEAPSSLWPRVPPVRRRKAIPTAWLEITLQEGRTHQVRRMTAAVGHPTLRLIRWRVGPWDLEGLPPGAYRVQPAFGAC